MGGVSWHGSDWLCCKGESASSQAVWVPPRRALPAMRDYRALGPRLTPALPRREFPHMPHSDWQGRTAYVRLSQTHGCAWSDLKAVCTRHPLCGRSRSCRQNRPIGELWAWLSFMHSPSCTSKAVHSQHVPSFEDRVAARSAFKALGPVVQEFLNAEAVLEGVDEPP